MHVWIIPAFADKADMTPVIRAHQANIFWVVYAITREHLNDETQRLFQSEGFAGLFITHSIAEAVFMSTRVLVMSARPGRIVAEYEIPFSYPRSPELRFDPEFARLSGEVSHALRGSHS